MRWVTARWAAVAALAWSLVGLADARDLPVPPDKGWQHAATGLILPASLDGLPRTALVDKTTGEFDVVASFAGPDDPVFATVYVYRPAIPSVPMWFERSEWMVEHRDVFGSAAPSTAEPVAFRRPGTTSGAPPSALRRIYAPTRGRLRSTALAVLPLGEWLVAVRMSSGTLAPSALDARLSQLVAAIRWPASAPPGEAAQPIQVCAEPLVFAKARPKKAGSGDALFSLLLGAAAHNPKAQAEAKSEPVRWCRDPVETDLYAVYRATAGSRSGYTLALADAGRAISVSPTLDAITGKDDSYSVAFEEVDGTTTSYPSFVGLPSPDQAVALVRGGHAVGRSTSGSRTITINAETFGK